MTTKIQATHEGKIKLGESELNVAVLQDGTRIISKTAIFKAFGRTQRGRPKGTERVLNMPAFLDANNLQPFVGADLRGELKQIDFIDKRGGDDSGYNAAILPLLCKVYLDARAEKDEKGRSVLKKSQEPLARASEILLLGLSNIGIIALVDEVTGYQEIREKTALQDFLSKFIKEETGIYIKTYPDDFFESIFKMRNLTWSLANKGKKPQYIGHYINNYVYSRIAPSVLTELRKVNPKDELGRRKSKHTQHIDIDYGHPKLKEHLSILTAFAKAVGYNWINWQRMVERALPKFDDDGSMAQQLPFND
ncbi:MAG: hypothetical protein NVS3B19_09540 [Ginsengibacter sp.]